VSSRPLIFFSHANSFPAGTYRKLFELLSPRYRIEAVDRYGHDPDFPVTDGWSHLVRQAEQGLARVRRGDEPVILVGHSLGGFLSLMLAAQSPGMVKGVIMLDSPVIDGWKAGVLRAAKKVGLASRFPPAAAAVRRRESFASQQDAFGHFSRKHVFSSWDADILRDYVACGVCEPTDVSGSSARLRFARDIEAQIYQTVPHDLARVCRRLRHPAPGLPVGFIYGRRSHEIRLAGLGATRRLVGPHLRAIRGGHLFPMEQPEATAHLIIDLLDNMFPHATARAV